VFVPPVAPVAAPRERVAPTPVEPKSSAGATANSGAGRQAGNVGGQPVVVGGIEFAGSAKEARERMKKKGNVKQDSNLSLRDKYELLQKL